MAPRVVTQEGKSPKQTRPNEIQHLPHPVQNVKPGVSKLSRIALGKREHSQPTSMPVRPTGQDERPMHREIAETPEITISRRVAETSDVAIGQRLPVRTTKVVRSIEEAEWSSSSSEESEASSGSEYNDEEWRRYCAQRGHARKTGTKVSAPKPTTTAVAVESTIPAPAPEPAETVEAPKPTVTAAATTTVHALKTAVAVPAIRPTIKAPGSKPTKAVQASTSTTRPTATQTATPKSSPRRAPPRRPRKIPVKLKDDPAAWFAAREGKIKLSKQDQKELENHKRRQRYGTANFHRVGPEGVRLAFQRMRQLGLLTACTTVESGSIALSPPLSDVEEVAPQPDVSLAEFTPEDVPICVSIERDSTPNPVDQLAEGVSLVVDLEDDTADETNPVKCETNEVPEAVGSAAAHQMTPGNPILDMVLKEVTALRSELQFVKGQVSAYAETLEGGVTESRSQPSNERGETSKTGRGFGSEVRTFTEPSLQAREGTDNVIGNPERPSKRPRKGKSVEKEKKEQAQGETGVTTRSSDPGPSQAPNATADQEQKSNEDSERLLRRLTAILPQIAMPQTQASVRAQQAPVATASTPGPTRTTYGGHSGSEPPAWIAGVNSIPIGPRQQRRDDRSNRPLQRPYDRREVYLPDSIPRCVCNLLHFYFETGLNQRPNLEAFPGTREEFFANVEQIVRCRGHEKEMIIFCEGLWACEKANRMVSPRHRTVDHCTCR